MASAVQRDRQLMDTYALDQPSLKASVASAAVQLRVLIMDVTMSATISLSEFTSPSAAMVNVAMSSPSALVTANSGASG